MPRYHLVDETATTQFAQKLLPLFQPGLLVFLEGNLGAGKTTFVKICAELLGVPKYTVHSPTFSLVNEYRGKDREIVHCDFYRLSQGDMLDDLGGTELFYQDKLFFLEWGSKLGIRDLLPTSRVVQIHLWEERGKNGRWYSLPSKWEEFLERER